MNKLSLNSVEWKEFIIGGESGVFKVSGTITTHPTILIANGKIPRVTCQATNNAVEGFYSNVATEQGGVLTVDSATIGFVSYQNYNFIATDHVEKLELKNKKLNSYLALFLKTAIDKAKFGKYGYGYKFSQKRIERQTILLPVDKKGEPNWEFMENYIKQMMNRQKSQIVSYYKSQLSDIAYGGGEFTK